MPTALLLRIFGHRRDRVLCGAEVRSSSDICTDASGIPAPAVLSDRLAAMQPSRSASRRQPSTGPVRGSESCHDLSLCYEPFGYRSDPSVPAFPDDKPIIVFDGHCALCTGWAAFVLRRDTRRRYRLLTAQSALGRALYVHFGLDPTDYESNILIEDGKPWFKSEGSIRMAAGLGWPWRTAMLLRVLPQQFRDWLYDRVAQRRLRWFGRHEACYAPAPSDADRFL